MEGTAMNDGRNKINPFQGVQTAVLLAADELYWDGKSCWCCLWTLDRAHISPCRICRQRMRWDAKDQSLYSVHSWTCRGCSRFIIRGWTDLYVMLAGDWSELWMSWRARAISNCFECRWWEEAASLHMQISADSSEPIRETSPFIT